MEGKFLPIGSVVILKEAQKRVMITGYLAVGKETGDKQYDYMGCLYPEGVLSSDQNLLFDHEQILKIYFEGYKDEEQMSFMTKLNSIVKDLNSGKAPEAIQTEAIDSLDSNVQPIPLGGVAPQQIFDANKPDASTTSTTTPAS